MFNKKDIMKELEKEYDCIGYISPSLKQKLKDLYENEDYFVGIHRTGYIVPSTINNYLYNVFYNGLINNGNGNLGIDDENSKRTITKTVSIINNPVLLQGQIKAAPQYKNSSGVIIVKIPKAYIEKSEKEAKPIYFPTKSGNILLSEYIYGYLPVSKDSVVGDLIKNPNYTDLHDYKNNGLVYEAELDMKEENTLKR